jgi:hypothetical protein
LEFAGGLGAVEGAFADNRGRIIGRKRKAKKMKGGLWEMRIFAG